MSHVPFASPRLRMSTRSVLLYAAVFCLVVVLWLLAPLAGMVHAQTVVGGSAVGMTQPWWMPNAYELVVIREIVDLLAGLAVAVGIPAIGGWAVRKHLIQQRWVTMAQGAAGAGLAAGNATGKPIDAPEFRKAAEAGVLAYAKSQGSDILKSKGLTDDQTIEAGMARVSILTNGAIGPNGSVAPALPTPLAPPIPTAPVATTAT